ncbi:SusC/RagA family TonB-linked outer membrane protein [Clostridia bacterium]|nr:SusC/RagA family TonB-linked outer membrane protein [Clostridia bacterium]
MKNIHWTQLFCFILVHFVFTNVSAKPISGIVKNDSGEPMIGVSILIKGTSTGTVTDLAGAFSLNANEGNVLVFSYLGYTDHSEKIGQKDFFQITLKEDTKLMDEVVVIGYATARKADITGAVSSLKSDAADERFVFSIADVMKGKVSGVRITTNDGTPGGGSSINIRGNTSLSGSNAPLYIIDGFLSESCTVSPGDIESIDILKDASSTAIYGSRGANGVILITTKKGSKKKPVINVYLSGGVQQVINKLALMNSDEFVDKSYNFSMTYVPAANWNPRLFRPTSYDFFQDPEGNFYVISKKAAYADQYYGRKAIEYNTDWQDAMTRDAGVQDYRLSIRGGGEKNDYSFMGGYKSQEGIMLNTKYEDYSARMNLRQELAKHVNFYLHGSIDRNSSSGYAGGTGGIIYNTLTQAPVKPANFGMDFLLPGESAQLSVVNPVTQANLITSDRNSLSYLTNGSLEIEIIKGLMLRVTGGYYHYEDRRDTFYPSIVAQGMSTKGRAEISHSFSDRISNENTLTYDKTFRQIHKITAMAGTSLAVNEFRGVAAYNTNFALEDLGVYGIREGTEPLIPSASYTKTSEASFFGRLNYDLGGKYLAKFTLRADGASRFAENNKWGYFPSGALGWRISEEQWTQPLKPVLDNLKLRLSWGISGKQAIGAYQSLPTIGTGTVSVDGDQNAMTSFFSRLANKNLKWETLEEWNIGLDAGFWNDKLGFNLDLYNRVTRDLLYNEPVPSYSGYNTALKNVGKIGNKGIEFNLYATPVHTDWVWKFNFNISKNISKVLKLGEQDWQLVNVGYLGEGQGYLEVGKPLGNWYGYKTTGIWQTQAEIDEAIANKTLLASEAVKPGYIKYVDLNEDGTITAEDRQIIGNGMPDFTGGLSNTLSYKGISLDFTWQFSYGNDVYNATRYRMESGISFDNAFATTNDRWKPELYHYDADTKTKGDLFQKGNPSNTYPIAIMGKSKVDETPIDQWVEDASFLRLADVTLAYSLPKQWITKIKLSDVRFFISASNLLVLTNYSGYDPEVNKSQGAADFLIPGLDYFSYPKAKTILAGINLNF